VNSGLTSSWGGHELTDPQFWCGCALTHACAYKVNQNMFLKACFCTSHYWQKLFAYVRTVKCQSLIFLKLELPSHKGPNTCRCSGIGWNFKILDLTICLEWISDQLCQGAKSQKWLWRPQYAKLFLLVILVVYLQLQLLYWLAAIFICTQNY
jgi:hypothetical protein